MTYQQAYDKIIDAYFKNEIQPLEQKFCFCGNLCDNTEEWYDIFGIESHHPSHGYSGRELFKMEEALFEGICRGDKFDDVSSCICRCDSEDRLFEGMSAALDVLKQIHRSRGEDVDQISKPFTKRQLV